VTFALGLKFELQELRKLTSQLAQTTQVIAQRTEANEYLSQRQLEAIRDLIEEIRKQRE
jgi:hypothetical protein